MITQIGTFAVYCLFCLFVRASNAAIPAGCYDMGSNNFASGSNMQGGSALCYSNAIHAEKTCCKDHTSFALGGYWKESALQTNHNQFVCYDEEPKGPRVRKISDDKCDQPCPGDINARSAVSFKKENGMCGGGCKGCSARYDSRCVSDRNVECGQYWSYFLCGSKPVTPIVVEPVTPIVVDQSKSCDIFQAGSANEAYCRDTYCAHCVAKVQYLSTIQCIKTIGNFVKYCTIKPELEKGTGNNEDKSVTTSNDKSCDIFEAGSSNEAYCRDIYCKHCIEKVPQMSTRECIKNVGSFINYCTLKPEARKQTYDCSKFHAATDPFYEVYCRSTVCDHCKNNSVPLEECLSTGYWLPETCRIVQ